MAGPTTNGTVRWRRYALSGGVLGVALLLWALSFRGAQVQILNIQPEGASNQFRLTWSSTPEKTYQLQRTDTLPVNNPTGWVPVLTLQATSTVTVARDVAGVSAKQRFYRVAELTGAGLTNQPPLTVSPVQ